MLRGLAFVGALLLFSISAAAQGPAGAGASGSPRSASSFSPVEGSWELSAGYQYNRINLVGTPFDTNGFNVSLVRFFGSWFGVDAQVGAGFGNTANTTTPPNLNAKSLFAGIGPRLALRGHGRVEPWIHAVGGLEHFRFSQTAGMPGSNTALAGATGGGVDYHLTPHAAVRAEADVMETRFFSLYQRHFQAFGGLVLNF